jgi:putative membrane protein
MVGLLASLFWVRPALAQQAPSDVSFVEQAATGNMAEMKLAKLALARGSSQQTKDLAQRLIADHSKTGAQLVSIAKREGFTLPNAVTAQQQADYDRLAQLTGPAFDQAFLQQMQTDHQAAISLFQSASTTVVDPALQRFASQNLPTLERHQHLIEPR